MHKSELNTSMKCSFLCTELLSVQVYESHFSLLHLSLESIWYWNMSICCMNEPQELDVWSIINIDVGYKKGPVPHIYIYIWDRTLFVYMGRDPFVKPLRWNIPNQQMGKASKQTYFFSQNSLHFNFMRNILYYQLLHLMRWVYIAIYKVNVLTEVITL